VSLARSEREREREREREGAFRKGEKVVKRWRRGSVLFWGVWGRGGEKRRESLEVSAGVRSEHYTHLHSRFLSYEICCGFRILQPIMYRVDVDLLLHS
jgi:hypothetical protein